MHAFNVETFDSCRNRMQWEGNMPYPLENYYFATAGNEQVKPMTTE